MELVRSLSLNARKQAYMLSEDPNLRRLMYIIYADDWIIGIRGTAQDATEILTKVTNYCHSIGLKVSQEKTKITKLRTAKALFLGVEFSRSNNTKYTKVNSRSTTRRIPLNLRMTALAFAQEQLRSCAAAQPQKPLSLELSKN
jgi:Reverse transcriptase (RNA-dependent DNA polymerase)